MKILILENRFNFSCLPNGKLQKEIIKNLNPRISIIDLLVILGSNLNYNTKIFSKIS